MSLEEEETMASVPSIKGTVFALLVEDVKKLVERGEVKQEELTRWLKPADLDLLRREISISDWYDIRAYDRMNLLLRDVEGGGKNEYLRRRGKETAKRLLESGLYQQLEYLNKMKVNALTDPQARFEAFGRDLRLLNTMSRSLVNFTKSEVKVDSNHKYRYLIENSDAKDLPETYCWKADGFINAMAAQHGEPDLWRWERPRPDLVLYRMVRSL
jgi:hypothetical protein